MAIGYNPPRSHEDLSAPNSGEAEAVWLVQKAAAVLHPFGINAVPVKVTEEWQQGILIQKLPTGVADTAELVEARVADILGEVMDQVLADPSLGVAPTGWGRVVVIPGSWQFETGLMNNGGYVCGCHLELHVKADRG